MYVCMCINTCIKKKKMYLNSSGFIYTQLYAYANDIICMYGHIYECLLKEPTHSMMRQLYFEACAVGRELLPISK